MPLTNAELIYYDSTVLRLPADKRKEYHAQVDRLIAALRRGLHEETDIRVVAVVKAGSFAKHTILRRTSTDLVDVDVVFYLTGENLTQKSLAELGDQIFTLLVKAYPTKSVEDFEIQRRAATVTFAGTGLSVDVVPVVRDPGREGYGWQYDIRDGSRNETCAPCQIKFVRDRKAVDPHFRTLVRLAKRWRNFAELTHLKSFIIELIMAHLLDRDGVKGTIEERFRAFLLYIAQSGLKERISFRENGPFIPAFSDPVVIIDPVCSSNNVASRITEEERREIVSAARTAWETAHFASAEDDLDVWREIFGRGMQVEAA